MSFSSPFQSQQNDGIFKPFSTDTPPEEMKVPEAKPFIASRGGGLHTVDTAKNPNGAFASLVDKLNAMPMKGLTPFAAQRDGNTIYVGRMKSIPAEDVDERIVDEEERRRKTQMIDSLKKRGILRDSRLKDDNENMD